MRLVLVGLLLLTGLTGAARAAEPPPFRQAYNRIVDGDFVAVGNGLLRCPTDNSPATGAGNTPEACAASAARTDRRVNDNFFMQWADVDNNPATYNSSSATVDLPAGAKVEYARLNWAANTGLFADSTVRMCQSRESETPAVLPDGTPDKQKVHLVTHAKTVDVAPQQFRTDAPGTFVGSGQYYSASADVTDAIAAGPVTVGNVWAPKGFGCMAGWSVVVVYSVPGARKRQVFVYDGHVRQNNGDPGTVAHIEGFRAATTDAHVGVTAYEGDWGLGGDQFDVSPGDNFFVSQADGRLEPNAPNNFSVDVRNLTATVPIGATSLDLGFVTTGDGFMAQSLALSVAVPELQVTVTADKPAVHPGDLVTFSITVTNTGGTSVTDIQAGCQTILKLDSGQSHTVVCSREAPADDFSYTVKTTGRTPIGDVEGSATAKVEVLNPNVKVTKTADKPVYRDGDTVTFTIAVTNTGDTPLQGIEVTDPKTPACARKLDAPGPYTCTATAPLPDNVNTAQVTAADRLGKQVTTSADAHVKVIHPALAVTEEARPSTVRQGDKVSLTVKVRNTGDAPLTVASARDDACAKDFGMLLAGQEGTYQCERTAGAKGETITATVTGIDETRRPVTASASATYTVIHPGISVVVTTGGPYQPGDVVKFLVSLRDTGDSALTEIVVTDPIAPDCARTLTELKDYECTMVAPNDDVTNLVTVTAKPPVGPAVNAADGVLVDVAPRR